MEDIISHIQALYTKNEVKVIVDTLGKYLKTLPKVEPQLFDTNWYKDSNIYFIYPDSLESNSDSPLKNIKHHLQDIKTLGCNAVHLLPFLQSPMKDKGYDISDYYKIREGLGGMDDLKELKREADTLGIHLFMDLVFNHVSIHHEWFIKAQNGNERYRNYFIHTKETPQFLGKIEKNSTVYAEYVVNGEKTLVSVAFPEFAGELPHWIQGKDGYWYYHTYYPHQIDVNWKNPEVFIEFAKVLLYWASFGFNFRFDAIPFIGKTAYKHLNTHNPFTHHITAVLNLLAKHINPACVFILETSEHLDSEIEYFGTVNVQQSHMLYSFQLTTYLWVSIVEKKAEYLWKQLKKMKAIPIHATWINFLRNHDELSFARLDTSLLYDMHQKLFPHGKPFREGFGIAGRTYSLLGSDEKRFLMSYFLLSSLPGGILLPYGDEFGMTNVPESELSPIERMDVRNINRGKLTKKITNSEKGQRIFSHMAYMLETRQVLRNYLNIWPEEIVTDIGVFGAKYRLGTSELIIFINLTEHHKTVHIETVSFQKVASVNTVSFGENSIELDSFGGIWLQK